jgi:hypothetical protein
MGISPLVVVRVSARGSGCRRAGGRTTVVVTTSCRPGLPQHRGWCYCARDGGVAAGMAAQGRWRWRRHASLVRCNGVVPCRRESGVRSLFEGSAVLFRGCGARVVREWAAQCHGANTSLTAQCHTVAGMTSPGGLVEQRRDMIPRRCQWAAWRGFAFDPGARVVSDQLMLRSGEWVWEWWTHESLKRGGDLPEGTHSPRARRSLARGGVHPSSEVEFRPRGRPALERGRVSPEGASSPRARQSFTRGGRPALEQGGVFVVRRCAPQVRRSFARGVSGPTA